MIRLDVGYVLKLGHCKYMCRLKEKDTDTTDSFEYVHGNKNKWSIGKGLY